MSYKKKATIINRNGGRAGYVLDSEVSPRAKRRRFSEAEKARILQEADECSEPGQVGELLRREGIYSSYLTEWRRERAEQALALAAGQPGQRDEQASEMARLRQENERLKAQVVQAELIIAAQKKLAQALEQCLTPNKNGQS